MEEALRLQLVLREFRHAAPLRVEHRRNTADLQIPLQEQELSIATEELTIQDRGR